MYDQNNTPSKLIKSDQDKLVELDKVVQKFDAIKDEVPVDLPKLKALQAELHEKYDNVVNTVFDHVINNYGDGKLKFKANSAKTRIWDRIINNSVFEGLGLDHAAEGLGQATDAAQDPRSKSITAGSAIFLALCDRFVKLANQIKTPLGRNRGRRGGGAGSTEDLDKRAEEAARDWSADSSPGSGETPKGYLPQDAQKTMDESLAEFYAARKAKAANRTAGKSSGYTQAVIRDKLLSNREDREREAQETRELSEESQALRAVYYHIMDGRDAVREDEAGKAEKEATPGALAIDAHAANAAAKESPGYTQAAIRDKLLSDRESRERREYMDPGHADGDAPRPPESPGAGIPTRCSRKSSTP